MLRGTVRVTAAAALVLVATYYLLASIPFSYYHFLQFPHFWWMARFITLHSVVFAFGIAALVPRHTGGAIRRTVRGTAAAAIAVAVCMAALTAVPAALSYELAAGLSLLV